MRTPRVDPEFRALIPPLTKDEYNQLEQNVLAHGCRDPIVLWRNKVIDGHNRFKICLRHGIEYETVKLRFPFREEVKLWILDNQLGRRNLTDAMRIELAIRKLEYMGQKSCAIRNIAREANVSKNIAHRYMQIRIKGGPEMLAKVLSGECKIGTAHRNMDSVAVTTTTREPMPLRPKTEEELNAIYGESILGNIDKLGSMYGFIVRHRACVDGMGVGVVARLGRQMARAGRIVAERRCA